MVDGRFGVAVISQGTEVVDEAGNAWTLGTKVGGGGMGVVYRVKGHPLAVKIRNERTRQARAAMRSRFQMVRRLPLDGVPISKPVELLRAPHVGFVMRMIDGVIVIADLGPHGCRGDVEDWFGRTGGLRRRLGVLRSLAAALERLHGRALVFGDLNPGNVLVSEAADRADIWLVDPDNVRPTSSPDSGERTKPYAAPEVNDPGRMSAETLSDAYSLAVLAYETLTLGHPLRDGIWVDEDAGREEDAFRGRATWIDHPDDPTNRRCGGLPPSLALTERLHTLARRCFDEGRLEPARRPGAGEWRRELRWAEGVCIRCHQCRVTYFARHATCPWCGAARPRCAMVSVMPTDGVSRPRVARRSPRIVVTEHEPVTIPADVAFAEPPADADDGVCELRLEGARVIVTPRVEGLFTLGPGGAQPIAPGMAHAVRLEDSKAVLFVRFGADANPHRVAAAQPLKAS